MSEDNIQSNIPEMEALISARPSLFMRSGALIILGVLLIILLLARFIQAPEVMTSNCTIYAGKPATLCCFENSGTLDTVMVCEGQSIQKGTPLATVSGSVSYNDYVAFHELKKKLLINKSNPRELLSMVEGAKILFTAGVPGEKLNSLRNNLQEYVSYCNYNTIFQQLDQITSERISLKKVISIQRRSIIKDKEEMRLSKEQFRTDSVLWREGVISKTAYEKALLNIIRLQRKHYEKLEQVNEYEQKWESLAFKKEILTRDYNLDVSRLRQSINTALDIFNNEFREWEEKNVIRAAESGVISMKKQWRKGESITNGEIFGSIFSNTVDSIYATIPVSGAGSGKIAIYQKVIFTLDQYPASDFGYLQGIVTSKSNIPIEGSYHITASLSAPLTTSWKYDVPEGEYTAKAEIITQKAHLLQRLFRIAKSKTKKP